jgi:hypothetical protein
MNPLVQTAALLALDAEVNALSAEIKALNVALATTVANSILQPTSFSSVR